MLTRPALSLNIKDLKDIKGQIIDGTHDVAIVTFKDHDGKIKRAYKKPCTPDYYPPLSAKYVVGFSTLARAALGKKACEDRLVYNDAGEIVATVSIEVPNFVSLLTYWNHYDDPEKEKMGCPTKQLLIKKNVAALLISAYIHKNHDLHPSNLSLNGIVDLDELYPELTLIIKKGERFVCELKEHELRFFPIIDRKHWPANFIPKNWNIKKIYKTAAFAELQGDKDFIYQFFTAILKELLAFDKKVLKERMYLNLGNEDLSLHTLPPKKRADLLDFGRASKLFFDENEKERRFVEHCMLFLEQEHLKFRNLVLNMPEFKEFLEILNKNPAKMLKLKEWFIKQNNKKTSLVPYNLAFIDIELHALWRESFKQKFADNMKDFDIDIKLWMLNKNNQENDMSYEELDLTITSFIKPEDIKEQTKTPYPQNQEMSPEDKLLLKNAIFLKIKAQATQLFKRISQLINQYQEKTNATIEDNHVFIENIKQAIKNNENNRNQLDIWLKAWRDKPAIKKDLQFILNDQIYDMNILFHDIKKFIAVLENTLHNFHMNPPIVPALTPLTSIYAKEPKTTELASPSASPTDETKKSPFFALAKPINIEEYLFYQTETTIIHHLSMHLKRWITPDKNALIKKLIEEVYRDDYDARKKYPVTGVIYNLFRKNGEEVYHKSLDEIFSDSRTQWHATSFKTLLVKKLCFKLLELEKYDPYIKSIYDRIVHHDDTWWSTVALEIAEKSNLKKSIHSTSEIAKTTAY